MQSFMPHSSFFASAQCLDGQRLNKNITEQMQIYLVLTSDYMPNYRNHPAVLMWQNHIPALLSYGNLCYVVWQDRLRFGKRGGKLEHKSGEFIRQVMKTAGKVFDPPWLGDERFHSSHRAVLLGKKFEWYSQFNWSEEPAVMINNSWPYYWPTRNGY